MKRKAINTVLLLSLFFLISLSSTAQPNPGADDPDSAIAVVCPGASAFITSNISGTNYQWQVNTGNGFENISDNSFYVGAGSKKLQLNNAPTSWYGYRFRCLVDGNSSITIPLRFISSWTGFKSTSWENPANWNCNAMPDANTDVIIYSGTVVLSSNLSVRSLKVNTGAVLTISPGYHLTTTK